MMTLKSLAAYLYHYSVYCLYSASFAKVSSNALTCGAVWKQRNMQSPLRQHVISVNMTASVKGRSEVSHHADYTKFTV